MMSLQPTEQQLDALREVTNIGCGQAVTALARLVGGIKIQIEVPSVVVATPEQIEEVMGGAESRAVANALSMQGALTGKLLLILPEGDAHRLCSLLLDSPSTGRLKEPQKSAMGEVANIVASACLSAIGTMAGIHLIPSVPQLVQDRVKRVIAAVFGSRPREATLIMACRFAAAVPDIAGQILVFPDEASVGVLLKRLGV
jgi:chemotaxis protein CheC